MLYEARADLCGKSAIKETQMCILALL